MPRPPRFTIRAASALTGINQNTLRAWERRHALIQPERTPKGYRLYSAEDLERLRLIQRALLEGVPIGRMRAHLESPGTIERLRENRGPMAVAHGRDPRGIEASTSGAGLAATTTLPTQTEDPAPGVEPALAAFAVQIEQAALTFDRPGLERAFARAVGTHSLRQAFHQALAPALARVSQRRLAEQIDPAAERFLTAFARERLHCALAGLRPLHQPPRALFGSLSGEPHDFAHMLLSLEVGLEGVSALYLGEDLRAEAVERTAGDAGTRAVALSATSALPRAILLDLRDRLARLPRRPRVLVGGGAAREGGDWLAANGFAVLSPDPAAGAAQVLEAVARA